VVAEARDIDHLTEQLPEQKQPDHRLDDAEREHPWLPDQGVQFPAGQVPRVGQRRAERHPA
jgi:hypothetical protein